ncbi:hypothetical protein IEQ_04812 [Bacillus cereus BAG6X1-2]|nr:hypothetical protein IEQ_04812 [Bacillus cereus BAG6X1-2]
MKTKLILDVNKAEYAQLNYVIKGRVGDKESNIVDVYAVDRGTPYSLIGRTVSYECLKLDNTVVRDSKGIKMIDATKGHFEYTFPPEVFSFPGKLKQSFFAIEKDKVVRATTQDFMVIVLPNALDGHIKSEQYISDLEKFIDQANGLIEHIKELEQQAIGIVDEELQIVRDHVNKMMEEIETSVEISKEAIEKNIKELELLVQGVDGKLIQLAKDIEAMIEAVKNGGALKLDGSNAMTGTINSAAQTPFQFKDKAGVWHRQTIDSGYWFQTRDPLIFSGISTFEGPGVNFKHKFLRFKDKDVLVDGDIEEYFGTWSLTEQSLQHNEKDVLSIDEETGDITTSGRLIQPTDTDWTDLKITDTGVTVVSGREPIYKRSGEIVSMFGSIRDAKSAVVLATLPKGFRPPKDIATTALAIYGNTEVECELTVQKGGGIFIANIPNTTAQITFHMEITFMV